MGTRPASRHRGDPAVGRDAQRDVARLVRPQDRGRTGAAQLIQQRRRWVAVVVRLAHRDHRRARLHRGQEPRADESAAVMRRLEHVGAHIDTGIEHRLLLLDLAVAGEQDGEAVDTRPRDERGVVRIRVRSAQGPHRPQELQGHVADPRMRAHLRRLHVGGGATG